jgi:hypothetical protein
MLLRRILTELKIETPSRLDLETWLNLIVQSKKNTQGPGDVLVRNSCGYLFFMKKETKPRAHWTLKAGKIHSSLGEFQFTIHDPEWRKLEIRSPKPGDRYKSKKLKEWFLKYRIPAPERALIPVLVRPESGEVVWFYPVKSTEILVSNLSLENLSASYSH